MAECPVYVSACDDHAADRGHYEPKLYRIEYPWPLQQPLGLHHTDRRNHDRRILNEAVLYHGTDRAHGIGADRWR